MSQLVAPENHMNDDDVRQQIHAIETRAEEFTQRAYAAAFQHEPLLAEALDLVQTALGALRAALPSGEPNHPTNRPYSSGYALEFREMREDAIQSATHDLKNMLAVVSGHIQWLLRRGRQVNELPAATIISSLASVNAAALQIGRLAGELYTMSVLEGELPPLNRQPIDLVSLAQRMVELYQQTTGTHQIRVVAASPALIGAFDETLLERVLSNLLTNAVKYSPQGGAITVTLEREQDDARSWAVVSVQDHGVGIPPADLPRIFERFYRAANVGEQIDGHGLGLASAHRIIEQHGGTLSATSAVGEGTTLTMRLPLSPNADADRGAHMPATTET
jgi:signal transduction histidine kinase